MRREMITTGGLIAAQNRMESAFVELFWASDREDSVTQSARNEFYEAAFSAYSQALAHKRWILSNRDFLGSDFDRKLAYIDERIETYKAELEDTSLSTFNVASRV